MAMRVLILMSVVGLIVFGFGIYDIWRSRPKHAEPPEVEGYDDPMAIYNIQEAWRTGKPVISQRNNDGSITVSRQGQPDETLWPEDLDEHGRRRSRQ